MSNKKQSSIDFFKGSILSNIWYDEEGNQQVDVNAIDFEQAKAMHRQEIEDAYGDGYDACHSTGLSARQYFEQTFKNQLK